MLLKQKYNGFILRLRDSYKRFVKTWIRTVSWITNPDFKRFVSYRGSRILTLKDSLVTNPVNFQRFARFYESYRSLRILSTIAQNESLKIEIRESESLQILKLQIRESRFANPNLKDSYRGFVS
jgi:UDP-galactopyranose mutase